MTEREIDRLSADYLDALDRGDFDALDRIWEVAANVPELESALHELHLVLDADDESAAARQAEAVIAKAVERHLPSAEVVRPTTGPITVSDVAEELFRHTPARLPPEAHARNAKLRTVSDPLPEDLGLAKLMAWAEARFGPAPEAYWRAFRQAALKLELRRAAEAEYHLAARPGQPKPGGRS